jgi:hypothetical protein
MSQIFEDLNDHIVFTTVKTRSEAQKIKDDAKAVSIQKTVVIFFENRYHMYLAPMQDPYKIRKEIDDWMNRDTSEDQDSVPVSDSDNSSKTTPKKKTSKAKR